jgi:lipase (class 3)
MEEGMAMASFVTGPVVEPQSVLAQLRNPTEVEGVPENTLALAVAAGWAYAEQSVFSTVMQRRGLVEPPWPKFIEITNEAMFVCAKCYLLRAGDVVILSFRGTEPTNIINWLADASVQMVKFHSGTSRVHGGFYRNIRALWPAVATELLAAKPAHLYITGHSFGAALAVLAAALLADYSTDKHADDFAPVWGSLRGVYTFGQPMVGDSDFAKKYGGAFGDRLFRYVYANDIVPHMPPKRRSLPLVHFGKAFHAAADETWRPESKVTQAVKSLIESNLVGALAWMNDQLSVVPRTSLQVSWADHAPQNYVRASLPAGAESGSEFD